MTTTLIRGGYTINVDYWTKPIPDRQFDWEATTIDYDLGHPIGYGRTRDEAIADLLEQLEPAK